MEQTQTHAGKITRQTTIQEVFEMHPGKAHKLATMMTNSGLHCVGCHASVWETIEQGMLGHGMSEEQVDGLVAEMNAEVGKQESEETITMTEVAAAKVKELLTKARREAWGIRVSLAPGGCSGFQYEFDLKEKPSEEEMTVQSRGVKMYILKSTLDKIKGSEIDYVEGLQGAGFKVNNPNVVKSCGCGSSVGF